MAGFRIAELNFGQVIEVCAEHVALHGEIGELAFANDFDESGGFQFLKVVRERGGADGLAFADVSACRTTAGADLLQDFDAAWVGERLCDQLELPL